jgi:hypothetical protein
MRQVDARITALPCMDSWRGRRFQSPGGTPANPAAGRLLNVGEGEHGAAVRYWEAGEKSRSRLGGERNEIRSLDFLVFLVFLIFSLK